MPQRFALSSNVVFSAAPALIIVVVLTEKMVMAERIPAIILFLKLFFFVLVFFIVISPLLVDIILLLILNKLFILCSPFRADFGVLPLTVIPLYQGTCDKPLTDFRFLKFFSNLFEIALCFP